MPQPGTILVFRFSALGDVAMTVPVINLLLQQHPGVKVVFVSTAFVQPLFSHFPQLDFYPIHTRAKHKGIAGLYRLYRELSSKYKIDAIADLHNVLRTQVLRIFFTALRKPIAVVDKGRSEKRMLTRPHNKVLKPLKTGFQRYADVFEKLGLPIALNITKGVVHLPAGATVAMKFAQPQNKILIGIAPFAQYTEKVYPLQKMQQVIALLTQHSHLQILLFGSAQEAPLLQQCAAAVGSQVHVVAGTLPFAEELQLIAQLHVMVSMDSANMHLASMLGVPVVSVWGGTHPYLGFYGWGQPAANAVQVPLACRPSSVFGNKPCPRGDLACMNLIEPAMIYLKVLETVDL